MTDWIKSSSPEKYNLKISRILSVFWALVLIGGASLFTGTENPLVEIGLSIASFTYGGLLGFFILGSMKKRFSPESVVSGFVISILVMSFVIKFTDIAWPLYTLIGVTAMLIDSFFVQWVGAVKK